MRIAVLVVEGREGFVHQQDPGVGGQGTRDPGALFHPAGEFPRGLPLEAIEPNEVDVVADEPLALLAREALHLHAEAGVLMDGIPGEEGMLLEHDAPFPARAQYLLAVDHDQPLARSLEARDEVQQRGFPTAAVADNREELVLLDVE
jgi:hypothetical protein